MSASFRSTKYGSANPDVRRAFFDRDGEIVRHSHREDRKCSRKLVREPAPELAQAAKEEADVLGIVYQRRHRHQTIESKVLRVHDLPGKFVGIIDRASRFLLLAGDVDLQEDRQLVIAPGCLFLELLNQ